MEHEKREVKVICSKLWYGNIYLWILCILFWQDLRQVTPKTSAPAVSVNDYMPRSNACFLFAILREVAGFYLSYHHQLNFYFQQVTAIAAM